MALGGHQDGVEECLLLGAKRTSKNGASGIGNGGRRWCMAKGVGLDRQMEGIREPTHARLTVGQEVSGFESTSPRS
jgi:hypothetical protein